MSTDLLRRGAAKLREHANAATPGPWTVMRVPPFTDPVLLSDYHGTEDAVDVFVAGTVDLEDGDRAYIALMHPPVALALADLLDQVAAPGVLPLNVVLAVARAVLRKEVGG